MPLNISTEKLTDGEAIALGAIEIVSIPHISIIDGRENAITEIVEKYRDEMSSMLGEVYQAYKSMSYADGYSKDISLELLWTTQAVQNQPYNAQIRLFVVIRAIDNDTNSAIQAVSALIKLCESTLSLQKYETIEIKYSTLAESVLHINDTNIKAIVKEEKAENLQNQLLPFCYAYDRIPVSNNDLSRIVNVLIDYPNCAVSMQLIPTSYEMGEAADLLHQTLHPSHRQIHLRRVRMQTAVCLRSGRTLHTEPYCPNTVDAVPGTLLCCYNRPQKNPLPIQFQQ